MVGVWLVALEPDVEGACAEGLDVENAERDGAKSWLVQESFGQLRGSPCAEVCGNSVERERVIRGLRENAVEGV